VTEADFTLKGGETPAETLANLRIVLVETSHPGNIGAAARAMKVMGLSRLYLVNSRCGIDDEARARASGAVDVLERAVSCASLDEALAGTVLAAACTSRRRDLPHPAYTPRQAAPGLLAQARQAPVAMVFGSETYGLSNEQLMKCRWLLNIPANPDYMSLNLASAVQVLAYELRCTLEDATIPLPEFQPAGHEEVEGLLAELEKTLVAIGFLDPAHPKRLMPRLRRFYARAGLEKEEVAIWRGILNAAVNPEVTPAKPASPETKTKLTRLVGNCDN
jgi:tRNA/rRNA methyltransferase